MQSAIGGNPGLQCSENEMSRQELSAIVDRLNAEAVSYHIGQLPEIRSRLTGKRRTSKTIFSRQTIFGRYAYRGELNAFIKWEIVTLEGVLERS